MRRGFPSLDVSLPGQKLCSVRLNLTRDEFLMRVSAGALPGNFSRECYEDILAFKSSLLSAVEPLAGEVPIQPVALDYADAPDIAWFEDEPGLANVRRILARPKVDLTIRFLDPLSGDELANRKTMTAAAQDAIARALRL